MARALMELAPGDAEPALACDRGVSLVPAVDRQAHAPDRILLLVENGSLVARCSCWWRHTAVHEGGHIGAIGHYAAADAASGVDLLTRACSVLAREGAITAIGPMDGSTWRRYRFVVERGAEPAFFLEPDNPDDWPKGWIDAGFDRRATYTSALQDDLTRGDPRAYAAHARVKACGIVIRAFDVSRRDAELRRIFDLSLAAFSRNFLYTPISEEEFLAQYDAVLPYVRPELVLLAERGDDLVGFLFAVPDLFQARTGRPIDTAVLKTLAVHPSAGGMGLGSALMDAGREAARALGFRRTIHALIHEDNLSRRISDRTARSFRRYALFSRRLRR